MKIALCIPVWKRHDLEKIVIRNFVSQSKKFGFEIIVAGSEGDLSKKLAKGCHYIEVENHPLSNKLNSLLAKANDLNVDGVVIMGSDDLVSDSYWSYIQTLRSDEDVYTGLKDIYFYSTSQKQLGHWKGYRNGQQSAGAGRFYPKQVLDNVNWKLWDDGLFKGLDTNASQKLSKLKVSERIISMEEANAYLIDVKHTLSITNHAILKNCEIIDTEIMAKRVSKKVADQVAKLEVKPVEVVKVESKEIPRVNKVEKVVEVLNPMVDFKPNGNYKPLGNKVRNMSKEHATILVNKGFGDIV